MAHPPISRPVPSSLLSRPPIPLLPSPFTLLTLLTLALIPPHPHPPTLDRKPLIRSLAPSSAVRLLLVQSVEEQSTTASRSLRPQPKPRSADDDETTRSTAQQDRSRTDQSRAEQNEEINNQSSPARTQRSSPPLQPRAKWLLRRRSLRVVLPIRLSYCKSSSPVEQEEFVKGNVSQICRAENVRVVPVRSCARALVRASRGFFSGWAR